MRNRGCISWLAHPDGTEASVIVCLRTVGVLADERQRYLNWIAEGRRVRQDHGILAELVLDPASGEGDGGHHDLAFP